ncbi:MAG: sporulation integral rane protein YtvI [Lacrimispora sp.]|jgi:sporulation integral membrane protein YtvI|nr:sporulation integral rane protein YtvI [Lacrimispora sp.]
MDYEKQKRFIVNLIYCGLIILLVTITIRYALGLVSPFIAAFLIAYILKIPAKWIAEKTNLSYKLIAMLLVLLFYSTAGILISLLGIKLVTITVDIIMALPSIYKNQMEPALGYIFKGIEQTVSRMDAALVETLNGLFTQFVRSLGELVTNLSVRMVEELTSYASLLPGMFFKLLLMIISTFFIAEDYDLLVEFMSRQLSDKAVRLLLQIKEYMVDTLFVYIRSYALIMAITFVELSIGLTIIRVSNAILIALAISAFDILPVLGTGGIMLPWMIIMAIQGNGPRAFGLLIVYLVITVIRNILEPKIVGSQIGLHPIVTLVSMFVGAQLLGIMGMISFPIVFSLLRHLNDTNTIKLYK